MTGEIAFLGTGIMGAPMAINLLRAGHRVSCYNRTRSKTAPVEAAGATVCDTPQEAARDARFIITMVTDGPDVDALLFSDSGALQSAQRNALWLDMSTIAPAKARELASRAREKGVRSLDAPVTGGEIGAINATLSIMVGGAPDDLEEARPLLEAMGKTITHCGDNGAGQSVKLCNQICGAMNLLGVCEALVLGQKLGIEPEKIIGVIGAGAGSSWAMQNLAPKIAAGDFSPGFMVDTQQKDMRLVMQAAEEAGVALLGAGVAQQLWRAAQARGRGDEGIQSLYKIVEELANLQK
jgi:3-hydroxyisobutyrate dehydrogenase-like beta-hydroxyacid dehydrogenase